MDAYLKGSLWMTTWQSSQRSAWMVQTPLIWVGLEHTLPILRTVSTPSPSEKCMSVWKNYSSDINPLEWSCIFHVVIQYSKSKSCVSGESPRRAPGGDSGSGPALLGPDMAVDITALLENLPENQRDLQLKQVSGTDHNSIWKSISICVNSVVKLDSIYYNNPWTKLW